MNERPQIISNLKAHKDAYFTNDLIFNVMASIMGIKTNVDEPQNDLSSEFYDANASRFKTLHGKKFLSDGNKTKEKK